MEIITLYCKKLKTKAKRQAHIWINNVWMFVNWIDTYAAAKSTVIIHILSLTAAVYFLNKDKLSKREDDMKVKNKKVRAKCAEN